MDLVCDKRRPLISPETKSLAAKGGPLVLSCWCDDCFFIMNVDCRYSFFERHLGSCSLIPTTFTSPVLQSFCILQRFRLRMIILIHTEFWMSEQIKGHDRYVWKSRHKGPFASTYLLHKKGVFRTSATMLSALFVRWASRLHQFLSWKNKLRLLDMYTSIFSLIHRNTNVMWNWWNFNLLHLSERYQLWMKLVSLCCH